MRTPHKEWTGDNDEKDRRCRGMPCRQDDFSKRAGANPDLTSVIPAETISSKINQENLTEKGTIILIKKKEKTNPLKTTH